MCKVPFKNSNILSSLNISFQHFKLFPKSATWELEEKYQRTIYERHSKQSDDIFTNESSGLMNLYLFIAVDCKAKWRN